jgi:hypothetical protein
VFPQIISRRWVAGALIVGAIVLPAGAAAKPAQPNARQRASESARERRDAASITTAQANALQAAAVAHGEANSALSNPYIEQKVTTAESTGKNPTRIPAGWF